MVTCRRLTQGIVLCAIILFVLSFFGNSPRPASPSVFDFTVVDMDGNDVPLSDYRGKVLLITNVASFCGFTDGHYKAYAALHQRYKVLGFEILAFPCNQFGEQEPKSHAEIKAFVRKYGVEFPLFSKVDVIGDHAIPLFKYLVEATNKEIGWNFHAFLVDRQGLPVLGFGPKSTMADFENEIAKLLQ